MKIRQWLHADYSPIPLIVLMVLTRFHHFGDTLRLPDASLAVFFLAGFYHKKNLLVFLLIMAFFIDYIAISRGTSSFCVSPAYIFLIPAYSVMWFAGQYCKKIKSLKLSGLAISITILALATSASFIISNGSFYLLSGRIEVFSWTHFANQFGTYYSPYLTSTMYYGLAGLLIIKLFRLLPNSQLTGNTV